MPCPRYNYIYDITLIKEQSREKNSGRHRSDIRMIMLKDNTRIMMMMMIL